MKREEYNYWLANINNIGIKKIDRLLGIFGSAEEIFNASGEELRKIIFDNQGFTRALFCEADIDALIKSRNQEKICAEYAKLENKGIYFVTKEDNQYPAKLKEIYDAPFALYVKGRLLPLDCKTLAIIGARECSQYGREMAKLFAGAAAKEGIAVISGLARGIDAYAHEGALTCGGITFGILGCGIDICYPKENINLYMEIQKEGGVISEYAPGIQPFAGNFPMRNRIISGLCDGILVIEAREKSGSLITVDMGLDQGKNIYALPGKATDRLSEGCNNLIKMGAKLVTTPKDVLEDFIPDYRQKTGETKNNNNLLETEGKIVYACLSLEPKHIEEIITETKLPPDLAMEQLFMLELKGLIRQTIKNYYVLQE